MERDRGFQYVIVNKANLNLALDIPGSSDFDKNPLELFPLHHGENQRWIYAENRTLRSVATGKVLDIPANSFWNNVEQYKHHGGSNQRFNVDSKNRIWCDLTGPEYFLTPDSLNAKARLHFVKGDQGTWQQWSFIRV